MFLFLFIKEGREQRVFNILFEGKCHLLKHYSGHVVL